MSGILDWTTDYDYLVKNPNKVDEINEILGNPPTLSAEDASLQPTSKPRGQCIFSRLPEEILVQLFGFLPTSSVLAVRLASRTMASVLLASRFWRSRFNLPHELCHVRLTIDPCCWPNQWENRQLATVVPRFTLPWLMASTRAE